MESPLLKVLPTSLGGTLDESTLNDEQKKLLAQQKMQKGMKKGGKVKSASARADGCCIRGKTRA
jgi:hypothetical protein